MSPKVDPRKRVDVENEYSAVVTYADGDKAHFEGTYASLMAQLADQEYGAEIATISIGRIIEVLKW